MLTKILSKASWLVCTGISKVQPSGRQSCGIRQSQQQANPTPPLTKMEQQNNYQSSRCGFDGPSSFKAVSGLPKVTGVCHVIHPTYSGALRNKGDSVHYERTSGRSHPHFKRNNWIQHHAWNERVLRAELHAKKVFKKSRIP